MKKYSVYILDRIENGEYYVGIAKDVGYRLKQHNCGNVSATKYKRPYKLVFLQEFNTKKLALMAEKKIKGWRRKDFIKKVIEDGELKSVGD